jgi:hypothetical protein
MFMNKRLPFFVVLILAGLLAACSPSATENVLGDVARDAGAEAAAAAIQDAPGLPTIDDLLSTNPITTSFEDAYAERDLFGVTDTTYTNIRSMPSSSAGYTLTSGFYELEAESFCLRAGTHGPSDGDGYLPAPLLGERRQIVYKILSTYASNPNVSQRDAQVLLWAIIASTPFSDMSARVQATAIALLNEEELFELNNGVIGLVPDPVWFELEQQIPAPVRAIYRAERDIRNLVASANSSYETLETVAVLSGAAPASSLVRQVPRGQWAQHPEGYFVRYFPSGYSRTRVEVYVPPETTVTFDPSISVAAPANTGAQRLGIGTPAN